MAMSTETQRRKDAMRVGMPRLAFNFAMAAIFWKMAGPVAAVVFLLGGVVYGVFIHDALVRWLRR